MTGTLLCVLAKEIPGGAVPDGLAHVPVEYHGDHAVPVAVCQFDPRDLDTLADRIREAVLTELPLEPILSEWERAMEFDLMCCGLRYCLAEIIDAKKPRLHAAALAFVSGLDVIQDWTQPKMARRIGVSKQDLNQAISHVRRRLAEQFGRRLLCVSMRDQQARDNMRRRNFRRPKGVE